MYGNNELTKLTELLRVGLATLREIARHRAQDYEALMDIAARSEAMVDELDVITGRNDPMRKLQ